MIGDVRRYCYSCESESSRVTYTVVALQEDLPQNSSPKQTAPASAKKNTQISRKFATAVCLLLLLAMCVVWLISNYNTQNILRQQADNFGNLLAQQTATQLTELVLANDMISMNVILGNLARNSTIGEIAVVNINNEIIAAAKSELKTPTTIIPLPIQFNKVQADYLGGKNENTGTINPNCSTE